MNSTFTGKLRMAFVFINLFTCYTTFAQTPTDGLMMGQGELCTVLNYSQSYWDQYWEGTRKRKNENIGTFTSQQMMLMSAYGINKNLNIIAGLPYVWTKTSDGQLAGQRGFQDLSVWVKYRFLRKDMLAGNVSLFGVGGASLPVQNYVADFLPMSIGMGAKTASLRGVAHYKMNRGFYLTAQAGYTRRSNITIDRDAYQYDGRLYYTNEVQVPDMFDATGRLGFINSRFQTEVNLNYFGNLTGDDIRRNDMPFPTNKMEATSVGWFGKYTHKTNTGEISTTAQVGYVLSGRNVGQSTMFSVGAQYAFQLVKPKADIK